MGDISSAPCGRERPRNRPTRECSVLAEGQGTWKLNGSNLDPVPAGRFEQRDSLHEHSVASRESNGASRWFISV